LKGTSTPCIGICSTGIGDVVCRGCKRFAHEVIDWNGYSAHQHQLVFDRLEDFLEKIVGNMIDIFDEKRLFNQMSYQQIRFDSCRSSSYWVYQLLRQGASQIGNPQPFGFCLKANWQRFSLEEIRQFLEQDYYTLSCAHYERYIELSENFQVRESDRS
jgi:predicted Fe-S protein YdhL (DUF1289 family)